MAMKDIGIGTPWGNPPLETRPPASGSSWLLLLLPLLALRCCHAALEAVAAAAPAPATPAPTETGVCAGARARAEPNVVTPGGWGGISEKWYLQQQRVGHAHMGSGPGLEG